MDTITETMRSIESLFKRNEPDNVEKAINLSSQRVRELLIKHNKENGVTFGNRFKTTYPPRGKYTGKSRYGNYTELNKLLGKMEIGSQESVLKDNRQVVYNFAIGVAKKFSTTVEGADKGFILVKRIA